MRSRVLIGRPHVELDGKLPEVVGAARHLQGPAKDHLEFGGVKRRPDQARVLEEELLRGISAPSAQGVPERTNRGLGGAGHSPAHVLVIEVRKPQKAQRERWNAAAFHACDARHELVRRVSDRKKAGDDGACTDTEQHVEVVDSAVGEAVVEALEHAHLVVDARDSPAGTADGRFADPARARQLVGRPKHLGCESRVARPGGSILAKVLAKNVAHPNGAELDDQVVDTFGVRAGHEHDDAVKAIALLDVLVVVERLQELADLRCPVFEVLAPAKIDEQQIHIGRPERVDCA